MSQATRSRPRVPTRAGPGLRRPNPHRVPCRRAVCADRHRGPDRRGRPAPARDLRARPDGAVLPRRRGRAERDTPAAAWLRLRLLRRIQRYPDRVAHHRPGRRAGRPELASLSLS